MAIATKSTLLSLLLLVSFTLIIPGRLAAQDGSSEGSDLVTKKMQETKAYQRALWFYGQRGLANSESKVDPNEYFRLLQEEMEKQGYSKGSDSFGGYQVNTTPGSLNWSNVGPAGLNAAPSRWGTTSGRVRALAIHPTNSNTVYIGAASGGLWKTTDGGASWSDVGPSLASVTYGAIGIDPNNTNTVYAGGGEIMWSFNPWIYDGHGMYKSTNGGSSWTNITNGFGTQTHFGAIVVEPTNSNYVYATLGSGYYHLGNLSNEGVWRSTDAGTTWTRTLNVVDAFDVWTRPDSAGYLYAACGGATANAGVWRSTDYGANWTKISTGLLTGTSIRRMQVAISPTQPSTMYGIIFNSSSATVLYKTTDGGAGWFQISAGTQLGGNYGSGWADQGWYDLCIAVHPTNPNRLLTGNVELHGATDGQTMSVIRTNPTGAWYSPCHVDYHIIRYSPSDPSVVYLGCDGGVYKSLDSGATWNSVNTGLRTIQFYRAASDPTNQNIIFGGAQDNGNFRTTNGGTTAWDNVTTGDGMECAVDPNNPNNVYMSTQYGSHYRSRNGGASFSNMYTTNGGWLSPLTLDPNNPHNIFVANTSVYRSIDSGQTFALLSTPGVGDYINCIAISRVNSNYMVLSANDAFGTSGQVFVSTNGGSAWTNVSASVPGGSTYIARVVCHPTLQNTIFAVRSGFNTGNKILRSTDFGTTWTSVTGNLPNIPHNDMVVDPAYPNEYYCGNDFGVYHTTDQGTTWTREGTNFPYVAAIDLEILTFGTSRVLRAATHGRSMYQAAIDPACVAATVNSDPANQTVCAGQTAAFVSVASGTPAPTVVWMYSTNSGSSWAPWSGGTTATISFSTTAAQNGYWFRAIYTNTCGVDTTATATLTVNTSPAITGVFPTSASVCENSGTTLTAPTVTGSPTPGIQWRRSTNGGANWSDLSGETNPTLVLSNVPTSANGYQYRVTFTNICGSTQSGVLTLSVNTAPVVTGSPSNQSVAPGTPVTFTASATGSPAPSVQWEYSTNGGVGWNDYTGTGGTTNSITFNAAQADSGNLYRARFINTCGTIRSGSALLVVGSTPDISLTITAGAPTYTTGTTATYTITVQNIGTDSTSNIVVTDALPAGMTAGAFSYSSGQTASSTSIVGNTATLTFNTLASGATSTYTLTAGVNCTVAHSATITNTITSTQGRDANLANNTASVSFTSNNPAPSFTTFPVDINTTTGAGATSCSVVISNLGTYATTDNCPGETVALSGVPSGNAFPVGTTVVTYTITDAGGRQYAQTQNVTVTDNTVPVPNVATLPNLSAECSYTISTAPTAADNCAGTVTATTTQALPWTISTQGTHTIVWTYNDGNGNTTTQNQTLVIDDVTAPVPSVASLPTLTAECSYTVSTAPTANDNCAGVISATNTLPITFNTQGTHTITWTYNDGNGNSSTQTQTVVVDDITAPVPNIASLPNLTGQCSVVITTAPTANDNCRGTLSATNTLPITFNTQGTFTVTWQYNDGNGNTSSQTQTVIVDDTQPPVPSLATLPVVTGQCSATVTAVPTATDNCTPGTINGTTTDPLVYLNQGTYYVTWTYNDGNGNTVTQVQTVIVQDVTAPIVSCPPGVTVEANTSGQAPVPNMMTGASAVDNCTTGPNIVFSQSPTVGALVGLGVQNVTVYGRDQANNAGSCVTTVTVVERTVIVPSSASLTVGFGCNSTLPFSRSFTINNGGGHAGGGLLQWTASTTAAAITITSSAGFEGDQCAFTVNPAGLATGNHTFYITITGWNSVTNTASSNSPLQIPVYVQIQPSTVSMTQTQPVTTSWTAFTNTYGQTFAEVKSNSGNIASMTVTAYPCVNPPTYPRVNFVTRYWKYIVTGAVNVDIRAYFTDTETKPRVVQPANLKLWQQPVVPGTWYNRGGTSNTGMNYVELTGVTSLGGNWMVAHPWVQWYPKPLTMTITGAAYNPASHMSEISWTSAINTGTQGFMVERTTGADPSINEWQEVGLIEFNEKGEYFFAEPVDESGVYHYRISTWDNTGALYESPVITIATTDMPGEYQLAQNYPNPFNPETVISYTVPSSGKVTIKVYDSFWRELTTLVDAEKQAGTHEVRFNASELPSGTYFYRMQAGSFVQTRKMNLTK